MLIRLSAENFLSIKDNVTLLMTPGKSKVHSNHVVKGEKVSDFKVLRSSIILGPNASGKSNIAKVLKFAKDTILTPASKGSRINYQRFKLDEECLSRPSKIEIDIKHQGGKYYSYGFVFDNDRIFEEWLYEITPKTQKLIFISNGEEYNLSGVEYNSVEDKIFLENTARSVRDNQLLLSSICNIKTDGVTSIDDLLNVIDWFENTLNIVFPDSKVADVEYKLLNNDELKEVYRKYFRIFNLGISDVKFNKVKLEDSKDIPEEIKSRIIDDISDNSVALLNGGGEVYIVQKESDGHIYSSKIQFVHKSMSGTDIPFRMNEESDGTLRMVDLFPMINELLGNPSVYVIDEIERSLHAKMVYSIFEQFLKSSLHNQLIATTHETQLLTQLLFRKDEIWFVNKNEDGSSNLYSMEQFKIRFDKEIRKDYLTGIFGALPIINNAMLNSITK